MLAVLSAPAPSSAGAPGPSGLVVPGPPCRSPRRAVRVGTLPRPRVRPLADVLADLAREREAGGPVRDADPAPGHDVDHALDRLAEAARPAAVRFFGAVAGVLDGHRPPAHLRGVCDAEVYADVVVGLAPSRRAGTPGRVRGVRVCAVTPLVAEASAVVHRDGRARAVAARLERVEGGLDAPGPGPVWRVRALLVV